MQAAQRKMLLALDGSEGSLASVKYTARMQPFQAMKPVLLNICSELPEYVWDMEPNLANSQRVRDMHAWHVEQKRRMKRFMEDASKALVKSGFSSEAIEIKIQGRDRGIARDILAEASQGYEWLMLGRKGVSRLQEIMLGSVALKILEKASFLPIMLVGDAVTSNRVLVGMDGSENAMRAVDFVANVLGGHEYHIILMHVIRGGKGHQFKGLFSDPEAGEETRPSIETVFEDARARLESAGFSPDQIDTRIVSDVPSRARALVDKATRNHCHTIVVGRRGLSRVQEFFIGRVGAKVVNMAKKQTVWVVT